MYNNKKTYEVFQEEQQRIMKRLKNAGIKVSIGKKVPQNGIFSGIVGNKRKVLNVNIPGCYGYYKNK